MRMWIALAMLMAATPVLVADAEAYTKEELKLEKAEVKFAKQSSKKVGKLAKKWHKLEDKGKNKKDVERELNVYYKDELANLRSKGVPTKKEEPIPQHPQHREKVRPVDEVDKPKMEKLRDQLVTLKDGDVKDKKYGNLLNSYVRVLDERYERKKARYKEHKKS